MVLGVRHSLRVLALKNPTRTWKFSPVQASVPEADSVSSKPFSASFWDVERPRFELVRGPSWLRMDESTGVLRGVPGAAGSADVVVRVTLERSVRRLDEGRLSWGQELVKDVVTEKVGSATQRFRIVVGP